MRRFIIHAVAWLPAGGLLAAFRAAYSFDSRPRTTLLLCAIDIGLLLGSSLLLNRLLIPNLLYRKRHVLFGVCTVAVSATAIFLLQRLQHLLYASLPGIPERVLQVLDQLPFQVFNSYFVTALGILCIITYRVLGDQLQTQRRYQALQQEQTRTELAFLKAQINPHFLFNSINSIYAHIDRKNVQARDLVMQFSQLLRYQLYECNVEQIAIEKEVAYLKDYVSLQRSRRDENLVVELETKGLVEGFCIAPLLLIPFVENAFKYASSHEDRPNLLRIALEREEGRFGFSCYNTKDRLTGRSLPEEGGIGISNVRRRLELSYPGRHELTVRDSETDFDVSLQLQLT